MRLGELLGVPVRTEDGESLGRLFDLRTDRRWIVASDDTTKLRRRRE